jgi:hypothetical protein
MDVSAIDKSSGRWEYNKKVVKLELTGVAVNDAIDRVCGNVSGAEEPAFLSA